MAIVAHRQDGGIFVVALRLFLRAGALKKRRKYLFGQLHHSPMDNTLETAFVFSPFDHPS